MAAGNLSVVADRILYFLDSDENIKEIGCEHQELLQGLKETISKLSPVLLDAERKSQRDNTVRDWVMELEDVLYDAENLLDDFSTELLRQRLMTAGNKMAKQVRSLKIMERRHQKIRQVRERINGIEQRRRSFEFEEVHRRIETEKISLCRRPLIDEGFLRSENKKEIISLLLDTEFREKVEVLPIVGRAGLGKTKLAQDVLNDERVERHFDIQIWIPVSEKFDVDKILRTILARTTDNKEGHLPRNSKLQKLLLRNSLSGNRYLIVLDDVQNEDPEKWKSLKDPMLEAGAKGSKILVTTRSESVANLIEGNIRPYSLSDLSEERQSWILFVRIAFGQEQVEYNSKDRSYQIRVGTEIVQRCAGSPLATMAMASMLHLESTEQWRHFYKNEFSKIGESYNLFPFSVGYSNDHRKILQLLKLCYDHLPSPLKHCFAYCSLFPKDHDIDVQTLIKMWMAQGFIIEQSGNSMEDVGYKYFEILVERYFLQEVERDAAQQVTKCKMHHLMHDLAMFVAGYQCRFLSSAANDNSNSTTFHAWFDFDITSTEDIAKFDGRKIRSIVFSGQSRRRYRGISVNTIFEKISSRFRILRALDMHASGVEIVPNTIGKLKLLTYLDLSENEDIRELPNSITELLNLQTLRLSSCFNLKKLPRDFSNLVKLRHLEIDGCNNLISLPHGIGSLPRLQTVSQLIVSEDSSMPDAMKKRLQEIEALQKKLGTKKLRFRNLRQERDVAAYLNLVPSGIQSLSLEWEGKNPVPLSQPEPPKTDLVELSIKGFRGVTLFCPSSSNLVKLSLSRFANCKNLSSVHQLSSLKELVLDEITNLEYISDNGSSLSTTFFSTLEEVWLTELPNLKGWWKNKVNKSISFPRLSKLVIEDCPNLDSMPLFPNLKEGLVLDRTQWKMFEDTMNQNPAAQEAPSSSTSPPPSPPLSNLKNLRIAGIMDWEADKIQWEKLKNLRFLRFDSLPKMETLPKGLKEVTSLRELQVWRCRIKEIPKWIGELEKLEKLVIRICPRLNELPEEIRTLRNLWTLEIEDSDTLLRRCEEGIGADWDKIAQIPKRKLGLISRR